MEKKPDFGKIIFRILILVVFLLGVLFSVIGLIFNESVVKVYSSDKIIEQSTLNRLFTFRMSLTILGSVFLILTILLLFKKEKVKSWSKLRKDLIINIFLLFFVLVIFLFIGEIVARIILHDTRGIWPEDIKAAHYYTFNGNGMRDRIFELEKGENTYRIAVVGDSYPFGAGIIDVNNTFPKILERELNNKSSKNFEVLNFGVPGYGLIDYINVTKNRVIPYEPDMIILSLVYNDFITTDPYLIKKEKNPDWDLPFVGIWLRASSDLYCFLQIKSNRLFEIIGIKPKFSDLLKTRYSSVKDQEITKEKISEIVSMAKDRNISVIIVSFPVPMNYDNYQYMFWEEFIENVSKENNVKWVNMLDYFKDYPLKETIVSKYDPHPNELGHMMTAKALLDKIREQ